MIDLMLDLETLGHGSGSIVLSGAIVPFHLNGKEVDSTMSAFLERIDITDSLLNGLTINPDTHLWWMQQDAKIRAQEFSGKLTVSEFCYQLTQYIDYIKSIGEYRIWATAPKLDFGCLQGLYVATGGEYPISHRSERCARTFIEMTKTLFPQYKLAKNEALHDPVADCNKQIIDLQTGYKLHIIRKDCTDKVTFPALNNIT